MHCYTAGLGSSPFARRYWGNRCYFLFLQVLRCFSSLRSPPALLDEGIAPLGLPHSDICGSMRICRSPQLFAACHVLPRLREPRPPPCALSRSVISSQNRTKFDNVVAIDLLDCETSVVFLLLSLAIDSLELIHDCQSASSMSLSFFLSGEPRGGQAP